MSQEEVNRLEVIQLVNNKQLSQIEAGKRLKLSCRQVRRLQRRFRAAGAKGLVSKRRGKPSNNKLSEALKARALSLIREHYHDFGPTFALEKLNEVHGLKLSVESPRKLMIIEGLWQGKTRKKMAVHQTRARRPCYGELIQIDGSPHDWFEGRGPKCCLLVFIDDATSRIMQLHFEEQESTQGYFDALKGYLKQHGRPVALYSDKHNIFRVNIKEAKQSTGESQLGRAMRELGIEIICANSPQAKGRVEKANGTLQDRLIKEMRLRQISSIQAANAFLPLFVQDYNKRFAVKPANPKDRHRITLPEEATLDLILSYQYERTASKNLEISFNNVIYQIQSPNPNYAIRYATIKVYQNHDKITLQYKGHNLDYKAFNKNNRPAPIETKKQVNQRKLYRPSLEHPWKQTYPNLKPNLQNHNRTF